MGFFRDVTLYPQSAVYPVTLMTTTTVVTSMAPPPTCPTYPYNGYSNWRLTLPSSLTTPSKQTSPPPTAVH